MKPLPKLPRRAWLLLLAPIIASAWARDWWAPDEPRYAEVAREIYASGEFLVMHLCGEVYRNKPPLLFWISGFFGSLADWSELAMRAPSILATLCCAWMTSLLARRFWGEDEARLAPILYLTTAMVLWHGARLQIDPLLGALCMGALVIASANCETTQQRTRALLLAGLLTGLGVLAKGPIAFLLVGLPLAGWRWIQGAHAVRAPRWATLLAFLAALAPGLCWALLVVARRPELAYDLFVGQFFERAVSGTNHVNPLAYHFYVQPLMLLPWTPLIAAGSWLAFRALRARAKHETFDVGLAQSGWWFWGLMLAFSASPEKRELYLMPAYPAAALLGARWIVLAIRDTKTARVPYVIVPALLALIGIALCFARAFADQLPQLSGTRTWEFVAIGLPLAFGAALGARLAWRGFHGHAVRSIAVTLCIVGTLLALLIFPRINPLKSGRSLAEYVSSRAERPNEIPCIGVMPESYRFYSSLPFVSGPKADAGLADPSLSLQRDLLEIAQREGAQFLALVERKNWERWSASTRAQLVILHEQTVGRRHILVLGKSTY